MVLTIVVAILLSSCSKELNRDEAKALIVEQISYPLVEFSNCSFSKSELETKGKYYVKSFSHGGYVNIKELLDKGLFTVKLETKTTVWAGRASTSTKYNYKITQKGRNLTQPNSRLEDNRVTMSGKFPIHLIDFKTITGIKYDNEDKTSATIEYTTEIKDNTKFKNLSREYKSKGIQNHTITANLYDDGWRLDIKEDKNTMPLSQFPNWSILTK